MSATFPPRSPRGGTEVLILRLVIAALVATLGVALWASGHVLIGGLILALAVVRLVLFFTMRHRRKQWPARGGNRRHRPDGPGGYPGPSGVGRGAGYGTPAVPGPPVPYDPPT